MVQVGTRRIRPDYISNRLDHAAVCAPRIRVPNLLDRNTTVRALPCTKVYSRDIKYILKVIPSKTESFTKSPEIFPAMNVFSEHHS